MKFLILIALCAPSGYAAKSKAVPTNWACCPGEPSTCGKPVDVKCTGIAGATKCTTDVEGGAAVIEKSGKSSRITFSDSGMVYTGCHAGKGK